MHIMQSVFRRMFGQPRGFLGRLGGVIMARTNDACGAWVIELLNVASNETVLEVGFGPGTAIRRLSALAAHVAGVDASREMVAQAKARNAVRRHDCAGVYSLLRATEQGLDRKTQCRGFHQAARGRERQKLLRIGDEVLSGNAAIQVTTPTRLGRQAAGHSTNRPVVSHWPRRGANSLLQPRDAPFEHRLD